MNPKKRITDATLKGLKPAAKGKRHYVWDALVSGFGIRSTDKGAHSYIVYARFGGSRNPSRRTIGDATKIGLADARKTAKQWLELANEDRDPKAEAEAAKLAKEGRVSVASAIEQYIDKQVKRTRRARDTERELNNYIVAKWGKRPLEEITKSDVRKLVEAIMDRGADRQAHNVFGLCRTFFNWAVETDRLQFSPCGGLRPRKLIGEKRVRTRVLDDAELRAIWNAAEQTPYPYGPFLKLLLLTGARKSEASDASWSEFDLDKGTWTIPEQRFKSGVTHRVPLSKDAVAILRHLPRWEGSDLVFSFDGKQPMNCYSKVKSRLDSLVNETLDREVQWQLHDLRRTVRTRLAGLGVPDTVAEQVIGHGRKGLARVYDQHGYEPEMRKALQRWATSLHAIVTPRRRKYVVDLREARRARG